jgi:hypothetical protein
MIVAGQYEVPDECPENCRFQDDPHAHMQGGMCHRCPVLNCAGIPDDSSYADPDGKFRLLQPEDYRPDWAAEWVRFFAGEIDAPVLYLKYRINTVVDTTRSEE